MSRNRYYIIVAAFMLLGTGATQTYANPGFAPRSLTVPSFGFSVIFPRVSSESITRIDPAVRSVVDYFALIANIYRVSNGQAIYCDSYSPECDNYFEYRVGSAPNSSKFRADLKRQVSFERQRCAGKFSSKRTSARGLKAIRATCIFRRVAGTPHGLARLLIISHRGCVYTLRVEEKWQEISTRQSSGWKQFFQNFRLREGKSKLCRSPPPLQ